ncbi:hypothetical protein C8R44DRAFT_711711 [Mycena epipterygia]|nr:hypothetical protein C8R44DRAFT_711711 [Mycena epipterygia]
MSDTPLPSDAALQRCPDLWFADCGLIVRADNVLFRVSREMLAARSPVFADMLSFTQPDGAEMIEGCPVVLLPDSSRDVTVFFKALFNHDFFMPYPAKTNFATISGVLRLSNKYDVDSLRKRALVHLGSIFQNPNTNEVVEPSWSGGETLTPLIILCREVSAVWILPYAFYYYTQLYSHEELILGYTAFDGSHVVLSPQDQLVVLSGALTLRTEKMSDFLDFLWYPDNIKECRSPVECLASRNRARRRAERKKGRGFPDDVPIDIAKMGVCRACHTALNKAYRLARRKLQDCIPEVFGLPDWTTLEAMKVSALK